MPVHYDQRNGKDRRKFDLSSVTRLARERRWNKDRRRTPSCADERDEAEWELSEGDIEIPAGHRDGTLELGLAARNFALVPDPLITLIDDYGDKGGDWGAMNWSSPVVTTALQRLAIDPGTNEARAHRAQVVNVLQNELPVIPVAWYRQSAAVSKKLEGVALDPLERSYLLTGMRWRKQ